MEIINLFGASGHAKVIKDIIEAQGDSVGVLYDDSPHSSELQNKKVLKASDVRVDGPMIISIGSNKVRKIIAKRYGTLVFAKATHPNAILSPNSTVGEGTVVMQGAIIQSDAQIGKHCIINSGASVDHECHIADFVHISPHATLCGNVRVGEGTWIGAGTTVIPGIKIGKWCTIGAGSVVIRDIPDGATAYGNPCKIKQTNMQHIDNQQLIGGGKTLSFSKLAA